MNLHAEPLRGGPLQADWAREVARAALRNRVVAGHGLRMTETPNGRVISLVMHAPPPPAREWPYGPHFAFGLRLGGATVTIYPGAIECGGTAYQTSETTITITGSGQHVGLALDRDAGSVAITGPHASRPISDADYYRTSLYVFGLASGAAYLIRECIHDLRLEAIS